MIGHEARCASQSTVRAALRSRLYIAIQKLPRPEAETQRGMALPTIGLSKGLAAGGHQAAVVCTPAADRQGTHQQKHAARHTGCSRDCQNLMPLSARAQSCSYQTRLASLAAHQLHSMREGLWMAVAQSVAACRSWYAVCSSVIGSVLIDSQLGCSSVLSADLCSAPLHELCSAPGAAHSLASRPKALTAAGLESGAPLMSRMARMSPCSSCVWS